MDWGVVVDNGLSHHASDSASAAVAPLGAWLHHTCATAATLLKSRETSWDIELEVEATARVATLDHDHDGLLVRSRLREHLKVLIERTLLLGHRSRERR